MKHSYALGKHKIQTQQQARQLGNAPKRKSPQKKSTADRNRIAFKDLNDLPPKVKYFPGQDGFAVRTPAPNYGKAIGMFLTILVPGIVFVYGPASEKVDPFWPRVVTGIIMGILFLAGLYCLLRKHELLVKGNMFRLSTGIGILSFRQKEKLSDIKSMWVKGKLRTAPHSSNYAILNFGPELEGGRNRSLYLGLALKGGSSIHALEGANRITLQYMAFALQTAIKNRKNQVLNSASSK